MWYLANRGTDIVDIQSAGSTSSSLLRKNVHFSCSSSCFCLHKLKNMYFVRLTGSKFVSTVNIKLLLGNFSLNIATISYSEDVSLTDKAEICLLLTLPVCACEGGLPRAVCIYLEVVLHFRRDRLSFKKCNMLPKKST